MICNTELDASHGRTLRRGENFAIVKTSRWRNFAVANASRGQILRTESQIRNYVCTILYNRMGVGVMSKLEVETSVFVHRVNNYADTVKE